MIDTFITDLYGFWNDMIALVSSEVAFIFGVITARLKVVFKAVSLPFKWMYKLVVLINALVHFNIFIKEKGWKYLLSTIIKVSKYTIYLLLTITAVVFIVIGFSGCSSATSLKPNKISILVDINTTNKHKDSMFERTYSWDNDVDDTDRLSTNRKGTGNLSFISKMLLNVKLQGTDLSENSNVKKNSRKRRFLSSVENSVKFKNLRKAYATKKKILGNLNDTRLLSHDKSNSYNFFSPIDKVSNDSFTEKCNYKNDTICNINIHRLDLIRKDLQYNVIGDNAYFEIFGVDKNGSKLLKTYVKIKLQGKKIFNNFAFPFSVSKKLKLFFSANGLSVSDIEISVYIKRSRGLLGNMLMKKKVSLSKESLHETKLRFLNLTNSYFILSKNRKKCRYAAKTCYKKNMFLKLIPLSKMNMFKNN